MNQWIKKLKVGDKVILSYYNAKIAEVERITPTGRIIVNGITFTSDGIEYRKTKRWDDTKLYLIEATQEAIQKVKDDATIRLAIALIKEISRTEEITLDKAKLIISILSEKD